MMFRLRVGLLMSMSCLALAQFSRQGPANPRGLPAEQNRSSQPAPEETPTFRSVTRLVQVDVVVRGKDAPVEGLTQADFEVKDNGKPQNIAVFAVRKVDANPPKMQALPAGVATNRPMLPGPEPVAATILFLDRLSTSPALQETAREQAIKFVKRLNRHDPVAIYALNNDVKIVQPFTDDRDALLRALENSRPELPFIPMDTPGAPQRIAEVTTAAFQSLMRQLKGFPGRKKLIWMAARLPVRARQDGSFNEPKNETTKVLTVSGAARLLNDANTAFYPVNMLGVLPYIVSGGGNAGDLALMSGGRAFYGDNALDIGLEQAIADTDTTYTLGFYQPPTAIDGQYHSITVNVLRTRPAAKGIKEVRYRQGYDAEQQRKEPLTEKQRTGTLNALVREALDATAIGIQAAAVPAKNKPGYYDVEVAVDISGLQLEQKNGRRIGSFDLSVVPDMENPKGLHQVFAVNLKEENYANALASGITVINQVKVVDAKGKPLSKILHFVVMDRTTGKAGSVRIPMDPVSAAK
ncbi:MAG: VWA domain-containing protein [Acidobacteriota bacterium]